ncbi:hypothetical protein Lepto7376_2486 [[Leptolyngbya] sp. PCC 7376]|uniref:hypothetical protein n=1 Tax=[Leptolyngbya] sp. PCC 7376 TaxID=111781 RepID=UPI00029F0FD3|nr:hypothetical protein [[Leptolyngbya] sp. PCC 7376]AFY38765.1 hypothetical protein Lepto7376_2486 [[Leptolyngbya] sp. PCC 7376]
MYNGNTEKDYVQAGLVAGLGAGVATSFAVSQGQNPFLALAITLMASAFAMICHRYDLI